ncbi:MAG: signal recognition particle-docking protein FtsY [Verrucomicrobiota bacterium]|nr:MAG: signal recognition particle-docking protein FtsY [Verrucomicrobiota bacterium]
MFGLFSKVRTGLASTKNKLVQRIQHLFRDKNLDTTALEAALYAADLGVETVEKILSSVPHRDQDLRAVVEPILLQTMAGSEGDPQTLLTTSEPMVIALIGSNGSGKTTTAAKLAYYFAQQGKSVIVGACDTFRAAANEQLKRWAEQLQFDLVESHKGADPSSVAFDTCQAALSRHKDIVILDTAGRLHNKANLMAELQKLKRAIGKVHNSFPQHIWSVIDASLGSNAIVSTEKFHEAIGLTGTVITKLDGSSRGGTLVGIYQKLGIPVYFIGLGERCEDLEPFRVNDYVTALLA